MSDFRKLSDTIWASPQIDVSNVQEAAAKGIKLIINNRPDGEDPNQPTGNEIANAARDAGVGYEAIPIDHSGISDDKIARMAELLSSLDADAKVLAYCRSGTRSTFLWSLARASLGDDPDTLISAASDAGYNVSMMKGTLQMLSSKAQS